MDFDPSIVSQIGRFFVSVLLSRSVTSPFVGFVSVMDKSFVRLLLTLVSLSPCCSLK